MKKASLLMAILLILIPLTLCLSVSAEIIPGGWEPEGTWTFDTATGTLTISGNGEISCTWVPDLEEDEIIKVVIEYGVTTVPAYAFMFCKNLTKVELPGSITTIEDGAFSDCYSLTHIRIPGSVTSIGKYVFFFCDALNRITFCGTQAQWNQVDKDADWDSGMNGYSMTYHTPHTWDSGIVIKQPTCVDGSKAYTCSECGEVRKESIPKISEHEYISWEEYRSTQHKKICACGDTQYEDHVYDSDSDTTCDLCGYTRIVSGNTQNGSQNNTQNNGSQTTEPNHQNASDHVYDAWEMYSEQYHKKLCACGDSQTEKHVYSSDKDIDCNLCGFLKDSEEETTAKTEKNTESEPAETEEKDSFFSSVGCNSTVTAGVGLMFLLSLGSSAFVFRKKKL